MTKQLIIFTFFVLWNTKVIGQLMVAPNIASMNGTEFCTSFDFAKDRPHICLVSGNPLPVLENMYVSYTWIVQHPQGRFTWNTSSPERVIPVPWPGKYTVKVIIKYFKKGRQRPFGAVLSNTVELYGRECDS